MTATLTIDSNGGISLPAAFLEKFRLKPGARLVADVSDEGMALRPDGKGEETVARLVEKNGLLVFTGMEPFDAVEAIKSARAERDEALAAMRAQ